MLRVLYNRHRALYIYNTFSKKQERDFNQLKMLLAPGYPDNSYTKKDSHNDMYKGCVPATEDDPDKIA